VMAHCEDRKRFVVRADEKLERIPWT
jgi:hypothetical protein